MTHRVCAFGQVIRRDRASGVGAYYFYDRGGALSAERRFPSGDVIRYQHDRTDLTTAVYKTGVPDETWQYDATGRVVRHTVGIPGVGATTQGLPMGLNSPGFTAAGETPRLYHTYYGYDQAGNRTSMLFAGPGVAYFTYYAYDARNMLAALTDPFGQTVYYERDALGLEIAKLLPNDVTTYHNYDAAGQVTSILDLGPGGLLESLYYTYDDDGQRTRIVREDNTRIYYNYDAAHRLTGEDWLDPSNVHIYGFAYEYDAAGNRTKKTFNGAVTYYDYNTLNQLATERVLGGEATYYTWTDDGAMATKQEVAGWTYYTWDVDESLTKIEAPDVTLANKYNARMQRVARDEDGTAETLIYDSQKLLAEAGAGALSRYYLSEGGSVYSPLVSQLGSQYWFLFDALGSTLGLTNDAGSLSDTFLYEAFGTSLGRTGATATPYQYVGEYGYFNETSVGLEQVWWRWRNQRLSVWLSRDTKSWRQLGRHIYARQQPTALRDPSGRQEERRQHESMPPVIDPTFGIDLIRADCSFKPGDFDPIESEDDCQACCFALAIGLPGAILIGKEYHGINPLPGAASQECWDACLRGCSHAGSSGRAAIMQFVWCAAADCLEDAILDALLQVLFPPIKYWPPVP